MASVYTSGFEMVAGIAMEITARKKSAELAYAEALLEDLNEEGWIPLDSGDLIKSGHIEDDGEDGVSLVWTEPYAADQYTNIEYNHPNGGVPFWAEECVRDHGEKYASIARSIL